MTDEDDGDFLFVMVECRNKRHARGKVAKVISYGRFVDEDEWTCGIMQPGIKRHIRTRQRLHRQGLSDQEIANRDAEAASRTGELWQPVVPRCNLCHQGLPGGFDHRSGDAAILNLIAARGDQSVGLDELHALASRRHKGSPTRP